MSNLCHGATINQLMKWRKGILTGHNKYYPKNLIPLVAKMGMQKDEILDYYYKRRRSEAWKKIGTDFTIGKSEAKPSHLLKDIWEWIKALLKIN